MMVFDNNNVKRSKLELTESAADSKIKAESDRVSLEYQRYGRNKETVINHTYINSGEYRNKFDNITDNAGINRILYTKAKEILNHRSGTKFEDMYWIDRDTGEVVASALDEQKEKGIHYTDTILKAISGKTNSIAFHNHPGSMPPSAEDFNSMLAHGYAIAFVLCHDGAIYRYASSEEIDSEMYRAYTERFLAEGYEEFEAQWNALEQLKRSSEIDFWEVTP